MPDPLVFRLRLTPLLLGLFVGPAAALTLGEVRVLSHLGEPLHATLPVRLDADEVLEARCLKLVPDRDGLGSASLVLNARLALREQVARIAREGVTDAERRCGSHQRHTAARAAPAAAACCAAACPNTQGSTRAGTAAG